MNVNVSRLGVARVRNRGRRERRGIITCDIFIQTKEYKTKAAGDSVYKQFLKEKREMKEMHTTAWGKGE